MSPATQQSLFEGRPEFADYEIHRDATIQERFEAFHDANRWVFAALVRLAEEARAELGLDRVGMKFLFEQLRWRYHAATKGDPFRLNNSFSSRYTRLLIEERPDLADMFTTRELQSA